MSRDRIGWLSRIEIFISKLLIWWLWPPVAVSVRTVVSGGRGREVAGRVHHSLGSSWSKRALVAGSRTPDAELDASLHDLKNLSSAWNRILFAQAVNLHKTINLQERHWNFELIKLWICAWTRNLRGQLKPKIVTLSRAARVNLQRCRDQRMREDWGEFSCDEPSEENVLMRTTDQKTKWKKAWL